MRFLRSTKPPKIKLGVTGAGHFDFLPSLRMVSDLGALWFKRS